MVLHLIHTRFQPGGQRLTLISEPFHRFSLPHRNQKPLKRLRNSRLTRSTRLKPGVNETCMVELKLPLPVQTFSSNVELLQ